MRPRFHCLVACLALLTTTTASWASDSLPRGPHHVGFRQQWLLDYGRTYQMTLKGQRLYGTAKSPRPVLLNLWYPTNYSKARSMMRGDYLDFVTGPPALKKWQKEFQSYCRNIVCTYVAGAAEKDLKPDQRAAFKRFMGTTTDVHKDGQPNKGKYPVVFYHQGNGSSTEDNAEFCEYLASYGYVVVGSSYVAGDGTIFNIDSGPGSANDVAFLTSYLRGFPSADWSKVGLVGHSGGAHMALKYRSVPGGVVDAIVSLDTTQDYYSLSDTRWKFVGTQVLPNLEYMTGPIMMVAQPYAYFALADKFTKADRIYYTTELDHNEFISQGVQAARVVADLAPAAKKAAAVELRDRFEKNYSSLCQFIRSYFDARLKGDRKGLDAALARYTAGPVGGDSPHVELLPPGISEPPEYRGGVPTPRQFRPMLAKGGASEMARILTEAYNKAKPAPIYHRTFVYALEYELLKTNRAEEAKTLHAAYTALGIKSAESFMGQAWLGDVTKNYPFAEEVLLMLLTLEPDHAEAQKMLEEIRKKKAG